MDSCRRDEPIVAATAVTWSVFHSWVSLASLIGEMANGSSAVKLATRACSPTAQRMIPFSKQFSWNSGIDSRYGRRGRKRCRKLRPLPWVRSPSIRLCFCIGFVFCTGRAFISRSVSTTLLSGWSLLCK